MLSIPEVLPRRFDVGLHAPRFRLVPRIAAGGQCPLQQRRRLLFASIGLDKLLDLDAKPAALSLWAPPELFENGDKARRLKRTAPAGERLVVLVGW